MTDRETPDCECRSQQQQCHVIMRLTTAICGALIPTYDIVQHFSVVCLKWKICRAGDKIHLPESSHFCRKCQKIQNWNNILCEKSLTPVGVMTQRMK